MRHGLLYMVAMFIVLCSCSRGAKTADGPAARGIDTVPMLIMQIQKHSRLYTAEYNIHKIVTHDDVLRLKGTVFGRQLNMRLPLGDRKIAIPMDARLKAYIDFENFSEKNIERQGDRITIVLPDPKVVLTGSRIDRKNVKEFVSLTRSRFSDAEMADYEQQGRAAIIASIPSLGIIETAQENAARVLVPMIEQMGYREENITVAFRKQFGERDLDILLDKTAIENKK